MTRLESRLFTQTLALGLVCTLIVVAAQALGVLKQPEEWLYDKRAAYVQFAAPAPSQRVAHLDIDDASLDAIGRWPWPRATLARLLDEVHLARPAAVGLDILLPEPQDAENDAALAESLKRLGVTVLATSFDLTPDERTWPMLNRVVALYRQNLEYAPADIAAALKNGVSDSSTIPLDEASLDDLCLHARRIAMRDRVEEELERGNNDRSALMARLFPHTDASVDSPLTRLLDKQYAVATAMNAVSRFGGPNVPLHHPPLSGTLNSVPLTAFCDAAIGCGFVNFDIFDNATVQSIPLLIQYKNKLYPQWGFAMACVAAGADPRAARVEGHNLIVPSPRGPITIPTFEYHSRTLGQDVPLIAAIPWFGSADWQTMYDWPSHRNSTAHTSMAVAWDVCLANDVIRRNNAEIDKELMHLLGNGPGQLQVGPVLARSLFAGKLEATDSTARAGMVEQGLKELKIGGWLEAYDAMEPSQMTPDDVILRNDLHTTVQRLQTAVTNNRDAARRVDNLRRQLATALGGKAVFVGFTAIGFEDKVSTSVHLRCPGVVVHGVIANAVLNGSWWRIAPGWVTICLTLALGGLTASAQGRFAPILAGMVALGLAIGFFVLNWIILFGLAHVVIGFAAPILAIILVWAVCTLRRVVIEGVERIRAATENEFFQREFSLARKVQFALVPKQAPEMAGINADGWTLPADMTGGDLFDLWKLPDGRLGILVADASGHGLAPAMIVSQVRTLVHMLSEYEPSPHALLQRVNTRLARDLEPGRFVTAFLAFLRDDGVFEWASAGHGPMYWCPTGEGEMLELDSSGLPLGVQEDWLCDDPPAPLKMELTGRLVVFSDGIFEAHAKDPDAGLFGTQAIKDILHNACHASSTEIIELMRNAVQAWQGKPEPVDDQTIVVVRRVQHQATNAEGAAAEGAAVEPAAEVAGSDSTVIVPVLSDFEIAVDNPVLGADHPVAAESTQ